MNSAANIIEDIAETLRVQGPGGFSDFGHLAYFYGITETQVLRKLQVAVDVLGIGARGEIIHRDYSRTPAADQDKLRSRGLCDVYIPQ